MRYYIAGGAVRDLLLGGRPHDFDIVFDGPPEVFLRLHPGAREVGKAASTYIVNGREYMPLHGGSIAKDLAARDLTINALLMAEDGAIHALPSTFSDLRNGILRPASPESFTHDPVRVFRTARLCATLPGFSVIPETCEAMRKTASVACILNIAGERVGNECKKAFAANVPSTFIRLLAEAGCLAHWFAPLDKALDIPAGPERYHGTASVFDHSCAVMDVVAAMPYTQTLSGEERILAVWMALCHDFGKLETDPALLPRHVGHEKRGLSLMTAMTERLRLPAIWEKAGRLAITLHMKAARYAALRAGTRADLLHALAASHLFAPFLALIMADSGDASLGQRMREDMRTMVSVTLPEAWRNRGRESAVKLRELRAAALAAKPAHPGRN